MPTWIRELGVFPRYKEFEGRSTTTKEKATALLQAFFPPQPEPGGKNPRGTETPRPTWTLTEITESEVRVAIFRSSPKKAPGPDDIPFLVWQKVWEEEKDSMMALYRASLRLSHQSKLAAKIVAIFSATRQNTMRLMIQPLRTCGVGEICWTQVQAALSSISAIEHPAALVPCPYTFGSEG
jgi:hypothetical protein